MGLKCRFCYSRFEIFPELNPREWRGKTVFYVIKNSAIKRYKNLQYEVLAYFYSRHEIARLIKVDEQPENEDYKSYSDIDRLGHKIEVENKELANTLAEELRRITEVGMQALQEAKSLAHRYQEEAKQSNTLLQKLVEEVGVMKQKIEGQAMKTDNQESGVLIINGISKKVCK